MESVYQCFASLICCHKLHKLKCTDTIHTYIYIYTDIFNNFFLSGPIGGWVVDSRWRGGGVEKHLINFYLFMKENTNKLLQLLTRTHKRSSQRMLEQQRLVNGSMCYVTRVTILSATIILLKGYLCESVFRILYFRISQFSMHHKRKI